MLHLFSSNLFEGLLQALHQRLDEASTRASGQGRSGEPASLMEPECILVGSPAMQRRLAQSLADRHGVCTNVDFPFLAPWLWRTMGRVLSQVASESPFEAQSLTWRVLEAFETPALAQQHARLGPYLAASDDAMRYELAAKVAGLLSQYTVDRTDWLTAWLQNRSARPLSPSPTWRADEIWQAELWRHLSRVIPAIQDDPTARLLQRLRADPARARAALPHRVHAFALPTMPPRHLQLLHALSTVMDVHVYALNPCREFWFDLIDPKQVARIEAREGEDSPTLQFREVGHPLLAAWGQPLQSQLAQWHDVCQHAEDGMAVEASSFYHPRAQPAMRSTRSSGLTRLQAFQRDVLELRDPATQAQQADLDTDIDATTNASLGAGVSAQSVAADDSVELHACHSMRRQLEALHNRLLDWFAGHATPSHEGTQSFESARRADDVLVVTPRLDEVAPMIDAVFGAARHAQGARSIAYTITGRRLNDDGGATQALMQLLSVAASRMQASVVIALLHEPLVMQAFDWQSDDVAHVQSWLEGAGLRWGLDAAHRASLGVPADGAFTLQDALDRLLLSTIVGEPDLGMAQSGENTAPGLVGTLALGQWPAEGFNPAEGKRLRGVALLAQRLRALHDELAVPQTPQAWHATLSRVMDTWLVPRTDAEQDGLRQLRSALAEWRLRAAQADFVRPISLAVLKASLEPSLKSPSRGAVPTGSVTFASMDALRSLPYRVIAMVGMDDGAFPTRVTPLEFDLMAAAPRFGDRSPRLEDRQTMLDLLGAARGHVWIYYSGRDLRDNSEWPPSVVVNEWVDSLAQAERVSPDAMRQALTTHHPLQPFAPALFSPEALPTLRSYHETYAQSLAQSHPPKPDAMGSSFSAWRDALGDDAEAAQPDGEDEDAQGDFGSIFGHADVDVEGKGPIAPSITSTPLWDQPLTPPAPWDHPITLAALQRFWENPAAAWLRLRLGVGLPREAQAVVDEAPMALDALSRSRLVTTLVPHALRRADRSALHAIARASLHVPSGAWGEPWQAEGVTLSQELASRIGRGDPAPLPPARVVSMAVLGQAWPLTLSVPGPLQRDGLVRWHAGQLRAKHHLRAWLEHLMLNALAPKGLRLQTRWVARDQTLVLRPVDDALEQLHALVAWMVQGLAAPLPFVPEASMARAAAQLGNPRAKPSNPRGDDEDLALTLAWRGHAPVTQHPNFDAIALAVFEPMHRAMQDASP